MHCSARELACHATVRRSPSNVMTAKRPISRLLLHLLVALPIWVCTDKGGHHHVAAFVVDLPLTCWSSRKQSCVTGPPVIGLPSTMGSRLSLGLLAKSKNEDESPGTRIMRQFEAMEREKKKKQLSTTGGTPTPSAGDGEGDSPLEKALKLVKDGTYGVVDKAAELSGKSTGAVEPTPSEGTASSGGDVKPSANEDLDAETQSILADLSSSNPIVKLRAEVAMKNIEARRNMREAVATTEEVFSTVKDTVYSVVDFAKEAPTKIADTASKVKETTESTAKAIQEVPAKVESTIEGVKRTTESTAKAIQEIPARVENTIEEVKATPRKVQAKVEEVNAGIENAKQKVAGAVEAVRSIPSNVQNTIENVRTAVDDIGSKIEQVSTSAKVLTGVEEPKKSPSPPKKPPPPPQNNDNKLKREVADALQLAEDALRKSGKKASGRNGG